MHFQKAFKELHSVERNYAVTFISHNVSKRVRSNQPFELYDVLTAHKHKFPSSVMLFCVVVASIPVACC